MKRRRQELVVFAALLLAVSAAAAPAETAVPSAAANTTAPVPATATNATAAAPQPPVVSTSDNVTMNIPPLPKFIPKAIEASPVPLLNVTYLQQNPLPPYNEAGMHKTAEYGAPMPRVPPKTMKDIGVQGKCVAWGAPASVHTFDGRGYSFQGHGEFIFFNSTEETIHVLQHRNQLISFNTGVALRTTNETFSMRLKKHIHNNSAPTFSPEFRWNQREVTSGVLAEPRVKVGRFFVHHSGRFDTDGALPLTVTVTSANGSTVSAYFTRCGKHVHLNLFIEVPSNNFETASGLCGNFNLLPDDDFSGPDDSELSTPFAFAAAWAVTQPKDSLWADQKLVTRDNVLQSAVTPQSIGSTKAQVLNASLACANVVSSFRAACIFNVLTCGTKAAADASRVEKVSLENGVIPANASTCMEGNWTLGAWGEWGNCSATCGTGTRSRDRQMFVTNPNGTTSVCTNLTQVEDCVTPCEKAKVWGKCSAFGYVQSFDGNVYVTPCTGEYLLYQSLDMAQQVNIIQRFLPNSTLPIPSGVAFRSGPDVFSISLTGPEFSSPRFVYNSQEVISISKGAPVPFGLFSVTRIGDVYPEHNRNLIYEIRTSGGTTVTVSFEVIEMSSGQLIDRLTAFIEVTGDQIGNTKGQCGSFDYNKENDFVSNNGAPLTPGQFGWQQFVIAKDTLFLPVGHIPASCPVNSTLSQITPQSIQGADPVKIAGAKEACRDGVASVPMQDACVTFYLVAGPTGLKSVAAPAAVIESSSTQVDAKTTVACLATPGVTLGPWGWWTDCSADCGLGKKLRSRAVNRPDGTKCGDVVQTSSCIKRKCPVDCKVSAWSEWSKCNVECGEGVKSRNRAVLVKAENGGTPCPFLSESKKCKVTAGCCVFGEWSRWTKCVKGTQKRLRTVSPKPSCGASQETRPCCDIAPWSEWSKCDNGIQQRNREVYGPVSCGKKHQVRQCCSKGKWSKWSKCKNGTQFRTRKVAGPANCAKNQDVRECCSVGKWFKWTKCDPKTRTRFRVRTVIGPKGCAPTVQKETCPAWELAMLFPAKKPKVQNATKEFPTLHAKMHFSSTKIIPIPETAAVPIPETAATPIPEVPAPMAAQSAPLSAPPVTPQPQEIVRPCVPQPCTTTVNCVPVVCPVHPADAGVVPPPLTGRIITPVPLTPAQTI